MIASKAQRREQLRFVPDLKPVIDRRDPCDELDLERRGDQDDRTKPRLCVPGGSWVRPGARIRSVSLLPRSDSDVAGIRKRDLAAHELLTGFPCRSGSWPQDGPRVGSGAAVARSRIATRRRQRQAGHKEIAMGRTVQHSCPEGRSAVQVGNWLAGAGAVYYHR
ncbi:MAG: hypothetical protein ACR2J5_08445, partial [Geodermatophilaceae bacterium]